MTIGDRIRNKRTELGISQKELADKLKIKKQTMNKYEMGVITNIPSDKIEEMAKIFDCSPCYIMGWEDKNSSNMVETTDFLLSDIEKEVIRRLRLAKETEPKTYDTILFMLDIKEKRDTGKEKAEIVEKG